MRFDSASFGCPEDTQRRGDAGTGSYKAAHAFLDLDGAGIGDDCGWNAEPMELAHLSYKNGKLTKIISACAGSSDWEEEMAWHVARLRRNSDRAGSRLRRPRRGNIKKLKNLPDGARLGSNEMRF